MKAALVAVLLWAWTLPTAAQQPRQCSVLDCTDQYLPPASPASAAEKTDILKVLAEAKARADALNESHQGVHGPVVTSLEDKLKIYDLLARHPEWAAHPPQWSSKLSESEDYWFEEAKAHKADDQERVEQYLRVARELKPLIDAKYKAYNKAIGLVVDAYHLKPDVAAVLAHTGAVNQRADLAWTIGLTECETSDEHFGGCRRRTNEEVAPAMGKWIRDAQTSRKGTIGIYQNVLDDALSSGDPDRLASTIYHETTHWLDTQKWGGNLIVKGMMGRPDHIDLQKYLQTEQSAYHNQAEYLRKLGHAAEAAGFDAASTEFAEKILKAQGVSDPADWARIQAQHPEWKIKDDAMFFYAATKMSDVRPAGAAPAAPNPGDAGADDDFLGSYVRKAAPLLNEARRLGGEQAEEKRRKDLEERKRLEEEWEHEARSYTNEKARAAAEDCGFTFHEAGVGGSITMDIGYRAHSGVSYSFAGGMDMDQIRIGMALLKKCLWAAVADRTDKPLCLDITDRFNQRWSEPAFHGRVALRDRYADEPLMAGPDECLETLYKDLKAPLDLERMRNILSKTGKRWRRSWDDTFERSRPRPPTPREPDPEPSRGGSGGGNSGGGGGPRQGFCESRGCTSNGSGGCFCPVSP